MLLLNGSFLWSQTIAVAPANTYKVNAHPKTVAKLMRIELIKLDKYKVLDEFDMIEVDNPESYDSCYSKKCLLEYGKELEVDLIISGSMDKVGNKIIITLKLIDIQSGEVVKNASDEFEDQPHELQRMIAIVIAKMHGIDPDPELYKRLQYKNEVITSNNLGMVKNSGPRMGGAYALGSISEFMTRPESQGGLEMAPIMSNLGYQFEVVYVGTENFSALFEFIPSLNGLEQGKFLPNISVLNGFRFGQAGWEFAFGPSFGIKKNSYGVFDTKGVFDADNPGRYWSQGDMNAQNIDWTESGLAEHGYYLDEHLDNRGYLKISTRWVMAAGRTFKFGGLNMPVNVFYSSAKSGGMVGLSMGFNITRSKEKVN